MQCPTDGTTLQMSERSGIEIDYCPTCRGVWLDRGELDKIIERSLRPARARRPRGPPPQQYQQGYQRDYRPSAVDSRATASRSARRAGSASSSTDACRRRHTNRGCRLPRPYDVPEVRRLRAQPARTEGLLDLREEVVRLEPVAEQRQSEHGVAGERERVLAQRVADDVLRPGVVDPVDLDDQLPLRASRGRGSSDSASRVGAPGAPALEVLDVAARRPTSSSPRDRAPSSRSLTTAWSSSRRLSRRIRSSSKPIASAVARPCWTADA